MKIVNKDLICKKHPTYQAKRPPRSCCWACHAMFCLAVAGIARLADDSILVLRNGR